jgi:hypothetical protein
MKSEGYEFRTRCPSWRVARLSSKRTFLAQKPGIVGSIPLLYVALAETALPCPASVRIRITSLSDSGHEVCLADTASIF